MAASSAVLKGPLEARPAVPRPAQAPLRAIALMVGSTVFFAGGDVIAKMLSASLPALEIAWLRFVIFAMLVVPIVWRKAGSAALRSRRPGLQVLRGLGTVGSAIFFTLSLPYLPVADATAIYFISPILITALAIPFLGEKVGWRRWTAALIGLVGVLVVIRPGTGSFQAAALLPLIGATCWAGAAIATRLMSGTDRPTTTLAYSALVGLAALTVMVPFVWVMPTGREFAWAVALGALSTAGHGLIVLAYRNATASMIAPFAYVQLIWAGALGFLAFGALPDQFTIAGACIIAASGLYTAYRERVRSAGR